jgi:hypothetical protein
MSALCHVLKVSSVLEEEVVEGDKLLNNLGMDDMAQIGRWSLAKGTLHISRHGRYGLERRIGRWPGREAEVVNPTLSEKANSIKYVHYPVGLESLCQIKTFSGFAIKLQ